MSKTEPFVHVQLDRRNFFPVERLRERLSLGQWSSWCQVAVLYYGNCYNFRPTTRKQCRWLKEVEILLKETCPADQRMGVHLVAEQAAFMGESIWNVDNHLTHELHLEHVKCRKFLTVDRGDKLWCIPCGEYVQREDLKFP